MPTRKARLVGVFNSCIVSAVGFLESADPLPIPKEMPAKGGVTHGHLAALWEPQGLECSSVLGGRALWP